MAEDQSDDEPTMRRTKPSTRQSSAGTGSGAIAGSRPSRRRRRFLHTFTRTGQGYWTRMGTVGGAALIIGCSRQLPLRRICRPGLTRCSDASARHDRDRRWLSSRRLSLLASSGSSNKPTNVDFLIATDSEMKKVNWTSRKELIGSTKIVIMFMFMIAVVSVR